MCCSDAATSDLSFAEALRGLIAERGLSHRTLAALTPEVDGRGLKHSYIGLLARGKLEPTIANVELLAQALDLEPWYFREYRERHVADQARELARRHGADAVLGKLAELEG